MVGVVAIEIGILLFAGWIQIPVRDAIANAVAILELPAIGLLTYAGLRLLTIALR